MAPSLQHGVPSIVMLGHEEKKVCVDSARRTVRPRHTDSTSLSVRHKIVSFTSGPWDHLENTAINRALYDM